MVGAGSLKMAVNLSLIEQYAGQSKSTQCQIPRKVFFLFTVSASYREALAASAERAKLWPLIAD